MKDIAVSLFIVVLSALFLQPLIETANVLKEKVTLNAAILNSCRAARNNSLTDERMRDLNAFIDEDTFRAYFAEAFAQTLDLNVVTSSSGQMRFSSPSARWNEITVWVDFIYDDSDEFDGRSVSRASIEVETPYVFRTTLLKAAVGAAPGDFDITETQLFLVQIIN